MSTHPAFSFKSVKVRSTAFMVTVVIGIFVLRQCVPGGCSSAPQSEGTWAGSDIRPHGDSLFVLAGLKQIVWSKELSHAHEAQFNAVGIAEYRMSGMDSISLVKARVLEETSKVNGSWYRFALDREAVLRRRSVGNATELAELDYRQDGSAWSIKSASRSVDATADRRSVELLEGESGVAVSTSGLRIATSPTPNTVFDFPTGQPIDDAWLQSSISDFVQLRGEISWRILVTAHRNFVVLTIPDAKRCPDNFAAHSARLTSLGITAPADATGLYYKRGTDHALAYTRAPLAENDSWWPDAALEVDGKLLLLGISMNAMTLSDELGQVQYSCNASGRARWGDGYPRHVQYDELTNCVYVTDLPKPATMSDDNELGIIRWNLRSGNVARYDLNVHADMSR